MSKFISNSFQMPNAFVDELLESISGNACKIYLLIVRKTRGWHKEADKISYSQIQKYTGINSRTTISKALDELLQIGLIQMQNGNEKSSNEYRLNDGFASPKNGLDKNCTSPKNGLEPSPKNGHTEIQYIKNTNQKYKSESTHDETTHADENQTSQNQKNSQSAKADKSTSAKNKKSDLKLNPNDIEKPDELDNQIWLDFLKVKKQRTKDDLSVTAWNRFINPVLLAQQKTNHTLDEIFGFWIGETKWVGFNCDWYLNRQQPKQAHFNHQPTSRMDELRQLAQNAPVNEFGDLPQNFYPPITGVEYE